jgi:TRAP-type C4-dicarboxylate transport system permease small subunit
VWIGFLGGAIAVRKDEHIGFDYVFKRLPPLGQKILRLLLNLGIVIIGLIMLVYGIDFAIPFTNTWFYISLPVSGALILLYILRDQIKEILTLFKENE